LPNDLPLAQHIAYVAREDFRDFFTPFRKLFAAMKRDLTGQRKTSLRE
jgi:hypothetical protein